MDSVKSFYSTSAPSTSKWSIVAIIFALVAFALDRTMTGLSQWFISTGNYAGIGNWIVYGAKALLLFPLALVVGKLYPGLSVSLGTITPRSFAIGAASVSIIYVAIHLLIYKLDIPQEWIMSILYVGKTPLEVAMMLAAVITIVPIIEELLLRHFIISSIPFDSGKLSAFAAVIMSAAFFSWLHHAYENWTTFLTIFLLGVVLGHARIKSGGLALPIILHSYASVNALVLNEIFF